MSAEARQLLETAAAYLRTLASALRGAGDVNAPSASRDAFGAALDNWMSRTNERDSVVPISELFYGEGAGLVEASQNPPTSPAQRFRLELVSLGEHLRQVVDAARHAADTGSMVRSRRDLKRALRALQAAAQSFGEVEVAAFVASHLDAADHVDFLGLAALEDLASLLSQPGAEGELLKARLREVSGGRDLSSAIGMGFGADQPPATEAPAPAAAPRASRPSPLAIATPAIPSAAVPEIVPEKPPAPAAAPVSAPVAQPVPRVSLDAGSAALIDSSIAALDALAERPLVEPVPYADTEVVPIETLLYRGRAALDRAVELRDEIKRSGKTDPAALEELFDLIELARAG
jgi:hypothetical protein